jgi:hypothetical protein
MRTRDLRTVVPSDESVTVLVLELAIHKLLRESRAAYMALRSTPIMFFIVINIMHALIYVTMRHTS